MTVPLTTEFDRDDGEEADSSSCLLSFESAAICDHLGFVYLEYGGMKPSTKCSCTHGSDHAKNITINNMKFDIGATDVGHIEDLRLFFIIRSTATCPDECVGIFFIAIAILNRSLSIGFRDIS